MKKRNRSPDRKTQKERIKEITEQLEAGVAAVFESDAYKAYLNCMSKFHNYSLNNTLLIALQRPDAQLCASYSSWQRDHGSLPASIKLRSMRRMMMGSRKLLRDLASR